MNPTAMAEHLTKHLGAAWADMPEADARAACKALAPELRRDTLRHWWALVMHPVDPSKLKAKTRKPSPKKEG